MNRICPRCGLILTPRQVYCSRCGTYVPEAANTASPPPSTPTPPPASTPPTSSPNPPSGTAKSSKSGGCGCWALFLAFAAVLAIIISERQPESSKQTNEFLGPSILASQKSNILSQGDKDRPAATQDIPALEEIQDAVSPYEDKNGYVDPEKVPEALDAAYAAAKQSPHVKRCEKSDFSLYYQDTDGYGYVYTPALEDYDLGEGELKIATFQPFYTENKQMDRQGALSHDALDRNASQLAAAREAWSFDQRGTYDDDDINDSEVDLSRILSLDEYQLVLWHGHGGYSATPGYFVVTGIEATEAVRSRYQAYFRDRMMLISTDNRICLPERFFEKSFEPGSLDGSIIYMGTCLSGYTDSFANLLVSKGAAAVFVNSDTILRKYNLNMMDAVMEGLRNQMTMSQALSYAKQKHGASSVYTAGGHSYTAYVYYRGQAGVDQLTLSHLEPKLSPEALYGPIVESWRVEYSKSSNDFCKYVLYDIDRNGVPELIVNTGTDDANSLYNVYTIRNGKAVSLGSVSIPYGRLYGLTESGLLIMSGHNFYESCHILTLTGDTMELKKQYEMPIEIAYWDEVCVMEPLVCYALNDQSGLTWRSNPDYDNWGALQLDPRGGH